jgi:hypothetical protein
LSSSNLDEEEMRMTTLQASRIREALQQAQQVGRVEEAVTIDGCPLVLQNLTSDDYNAISSEVEGLEDVEYLHAFQAAQVCRAIVEIGDQDLRSVDFVEEEVPSGRCVLQVTLPKAKAEDLLKQARGLGGEGAIIPDGETKVVKMERHEWIRHYILSGWGREALTVAWRKFTEEERVKEGVQFKVPEESSEERYRRLLGELKEVEEDLPSELTAKILDEVGYLSKSSREELEAVEDKLRKIVSQQPEKAEAEAEEQPQPQPQQEDPQVLMRRRQPLNRQAVVPPVPQAQVAPQSKPADKVPVPEQLREVAQANTSKLSRSAQIAALEGTVDPSLEQDLQAVPVPLRTEVAELSKNLTEIDRQEAARITDQPPVVGINPRFKRRPV